VLSERGCEVRQAAIEFTDRRYADRFSRLPLPFPKLLGMLPAQLRRGSGEIRIPGSAPGHTFPELLADPSYAPYEPHKVTAVEIDPMPVSGDTGIVIPDAPRLVGGTMLPHFTAAGWAAAARAP
jgi:hypothetical protein